MMREWSVLAFNLSPVCEAEANSLSHSFVATLATKAQAIGTHLPALNVMYLFIKSEWTKFKTAHLRAQRLRKEVIFPLTIVLSYLHG